MAFFIHFRETIYFSSKANRQSTCKNFYVLCQYFWLANTKLVQLAPLKNKFGQNFEKSKKLTQAVVFQPCF